MAKLLYGNSPIKSCPDGKSSLGGKDIAYRRFKDVTKGDLTFTVKAARNHTSVTKDAEVVAKTIAEHAFPHVVTGHIGPSEAVAVFKV